MTATNPIVFLDIRIEEEKIGRVIIELFADVVPKTVENFLGLCVGSKISPKTGKRLHYKGTIFHKVIPFVFIQGGDVVNMDGSSGESIFGTPFEDENYTLQHYCPGLLSSVNSGQNSNTSQFIITLDECPHLDGSCVVFGKVLRGLACVIEVSEVKTEADCPTLKCMIEDCGQILLGEPWNYIDNDGTVDTYPPDPRDLEKKDLNLAKIIEMIANIKESGNFFFNKHNYVVADGKYKKAVRYINYWTDRSKNQNIEDIDKNEVFEKLDQEKIYCLLNSAAVALKRGLYRRSLNLCDEVLRKDKENPKAHFRRGKALKYLNDFEGALTEQKKALSLAPNDKSISDEINDINYMIRNYLVQEKQVFSKMFYSLK